MDEKQWINKAVRLLRAIRFNAEHPSPQREIIGGNELDLVNMLLKEAE